MTITAPLLLVDDDPDDQDICIEILKDIGVKSEIITFSSCVDAYQYLRDDSREAPFLIISDINLPSINGLELKKLIDGDSILKIKSIPFIFYTTAADPQTIRKAYEFNVQGFFVKETSLEKIRSTFQLILDYWIKSKQPL